MTPREKHLRVALSQAKFTFGEIDCTVDTPLAEKGMEDAEKAKQEADMMQDGPGEEDKKWLKTVILWWDTEHDFSKATDIDMYAIGYQGMIYLEEAIPKLKKYVGMP